MDPALIEGLVAPTLSLLQIDTSVGEVLDATALDPVGLAARLVLFVLLLAFSALFSGSEVALFSITAGERESLREATDRASRRVAHLLDRPRRLLVAILLLNTLVNVGAAILSAQLTLTLASVYGWSETLVLGVQVLALTFILLVTSEIAPKLLASQQPVAFARRTTALLAPAIRLLAPVADVLARLADRIQKRLRTTEDLLSSEDIKTMADVGEQQGSLEEEERALIHSIVEFGETTVREVMVSRVDVTALADGASLDDALALIRESGHSRFPLFRDHLDHVLGVVYAKDLLPYIGGGSAGRDRVPEPPDWVAFSRTPRFVPATKRLDDMLADFQRTNTHMAIVVDEYGGTAGLVTLEDLLEEVVGEIRDELDDVEEETLIRPDGEGTWRVEARIDLDDLADATGVEMATETFDFETLGGLIFHLLGEVPAPNDELLYGRLRLRVDAVEENRIQDVTVRVAEASQPEPEA